MERQTRQAAEDLDAARGRTLARFNGGVEQLYLNTVRGRSGEYQESRIEVRAGYDGTVPVVQHSMSEEPSLSPREQADGTAVAVVNATPQGLFVDRVQRRVTIYPGQAGYEREASALDGYGRRVDQRAAARAASLPGLSAAAERGRAAADAAARERDASLRDRDRILSRYQELSDRIGAQQALEARIQALKAGIASLTSQLAWWTRYAARLAAVREGGPVFPTPGPANPGTAGGFWAAVLALFGLLSALAGLWWAWRGGVLARPRPS
jgi:hypothetical protein